MKLAAQNLDTPGQKRTSEDGALNLVSLGSATVGRGVYGPGWRWSADVKPDAGTDSCQATHVGYVLSGRFRIRMDDGTEKPTSVRAMRMSSAPATMPGWWATSRASSSTSPPHSDPRPAKAPAPWWCDATNHAASSSAPNAATSSTT
jgi:hypothetical protein